MSERRGLAYLIATMAIAWLFSGAITIHLLYDAAFEAQRARLVDSVEAQARLDAGYHVLAARDGHDANKQVRGHGRPIGLLLLDLGVPGPSGSALAAALQAVHPEAAVLYMSGLSVREAVAQGRLNDASVPFVHKPIELDDLVARIDEVLAGSSLAEP